ncbi:TM2 domain-containing protein [Paenibacillus thalictri]|uniref:TM2 domain-containing protein n=1 Tax=Paenibacillus thalictri TaxID=2527873 RepID=A0A4Q9DR00_9BACL|nr:TM2 domain-containing protein [Paenibacillus thalictri]TBL77334.1 TM2 domain-containing protein [Paenibacillus thalictri]
MKSRVTAGVLAILLGGFGIHKFYLGKIGIGIVYLLFCWTGIPSIIGLIEGILYLTKTDSEFQQKYASA